MIDYYEEIRNKESNNPNKYDNLTSLQLVEKIKEMDNWREDQDLLTQLYLTAICDAEDEIYSELDYFSEELYYMILYAYSNYNDACKNFINVNFIDGKETLAGYILAFNKYHQILDNDLAIKKFCTIDDLKENTMLYFMNILGFRYTDIELIIKDIFDLDQITFDQLNDIEYIKSFIEKFK